MTAKRLANSNRMHKTLCQLIRDNLGRPLESYCEVGVLEGDLAAAVLTTLKPSRMTLVDTWRPYPIGRPTPPSPEWDKHSLKTVLELEEMYGRVLERFPGYKQVDIHRVLSVDYANDCPSHFDVAFIDADHRYETTKADVKAYWPLVKERGLLMGHDYNSRAEKSRGYWGVKRAVDEFAKSNGLEVNVASHKIWWIKK